MRISTRGRELPRIGQLAARRLRYAPTITRAHVRIYRLTRGRIGHRVLRWRFMLIETTGRHTGGAHTVPVAYLAHGAELAVVASNAGATRHPAWYHNLVENPSVIIDVGKARVSAQARVADAAETKALWPRFEAMFGSFTAYRRRAGRELPIVLLLPSTVSR